jgi:hypothetical protein
VAVPDAPRGRLLSESIRLPEAYAKELGSEPTMGAEFAADLKEIINSRRPRDLSAHWLSPFPSFNYKTEDEERFLSAQGDTFAGANVEEKASACCVRNDGGAVEGLSGGGGEGLDQGGEFEDFEVAGAVGPVVAPADDDVAAGEGVAVVAEIAALKFEFEMDALPAMRGDLALGFAVREAGLHGFDGVAEFFGDHAEEQDDALFVDGLVAEAAEIHGLAVGWAAVQRRVAKFGGRRRGW